MAVLDKICADKACHVAAQKDKISLEDIKAQAFDTPPPRGFINALKKADDIALIAEVKKASPSKGIIREDFDPVSIAKTYEAGGASCLSVLTDEPYFQGHDDYFTAIRSAVSLPMLRKDFMIDPYQIYESRALGADCILIIMACLSDDQAEELYGLSTELGMDVLVETHDAEEIERAKRLAPKMVGVNNRNLKTLEVSHETGLTMAKNLPNDVLRIAESGIYNHDDIQKFKKAGYAGFLIGESLMREADIALALKNILKNN